MNGGIMLAWCGHATSDSVEDDFVFPTKSRFFTVSCFSRQCKQWTQIENEKELERFLIFIQNHGFVFFRATSKNTPEQSRGSFGCWLVFSFSSLFEKSISCTEIRRSSRWTPCPGPTCPATWTSSRRRRRRCRDFRATRSTSGAARGSEVRLLASRHDWDQKSRRRRAASTTTGWRATTRTSLQRRTGRRCAAAAPPPRPRPSKSLRRSRTCPCSCFRWPLSWEGGGGPGPGRIPKLSGWRTKPGIRQMKPILVTYWWLRSVWSWSSRLIASDIRSWFP